MRYRFASGFALAIGLVACSTSSTECGDLGGPDAAVPGDLASAPHDLYHAPPMDFARQGDAGPRFDGGAMCQAFCAGCSDTQDCFTSDDTSAECLDHCATTTDCPKGWTCAELVENPLEVGGVPAQLSGRLCFSTAQGHPMICRGFPADSGCIATDAARCFDPFTIRRPVSVPGTCGYEYASCPKGCTTPDAGGPPTCL